MVGDQRNGEGFNPLDLDAIIAADAERKRQKKASERIITFREYLQLLTRDPKIAQSSPMRFLEIILAAGVRTLPAEERWLSAKKEYLLFSTQLFGVHDAIAQIVNYFAAGAAGDPIGKMLMVMVGPPSSGKSTVVNILKRALEAYDGRPVYAIQGCRVRHEPLLLLPRHLRPEFERKLKVRIRGDLCPRCRHRLQTEFKDEDGTIRWWDFPVEQFTFSIQGSRGIASFEPSDQKTQDMTALVGRENLGVTSDPRRGYDDPEAFELNGEVENANRGLIEGREILLVDPEILRIFISLCEEQEIKVQGSSFPHISIDTVPTGHINLTGYEKFSADQRNEALHDRIYVVQFPYLLRIRDEVRVYRKLLEHEEFADLKRAHIAPGALELSALFAVLTRLVPSQMGVSLLTKAKAYNGDRVLTELVDKDKHPIDIRTLIEEGQAPKELRKKEGMFGVSSRDVMAALSTALAQESGMNGCLTPLRALRSLRQVFEHRMGYTPEELERFQELLSASEGESVMAEYKEFVLREVNRAFLRAYEDLARELLRKYIANVRLDRLQKHRFVRGGLLAVERDELTDKPKEADEKFLRSVEEQIGIAASEADRFRGEILDLIGVLGQVELETYPPLREAVERKLLADTKAALTLVISPDKPKGEEEKRRAADLLNGLKERGFCDVCSRELIERAAEFLNE